MKIKICGLREPDNILDVMKLKPDYVGFIFHESSRRFAGNEPLAQWLRTHDELFVNTARTGVFVNAAVDVILNTVHDFHLDWVQLHGNESAGYCRELKLLWSVSTLRKASIAKAFSITPDFDFSVTADYADSCQLFVFDTGGHQQAGGTGQQWDWRKLKDYTGSTPFLLSGGIGPEDVPRVNALEHPALVGLDLNSKFESEPGVKNAGLLAKFLDGIKP